MRPHRIAYLRLLGRPLHITVCEKVCGQTKNEGILDNSHGEKSFERNLSPCHNNMFEMTSQYNSRFSNSMTQHYWTVCARLMTPSLLGKKVYCLFVNPILYDHVCAKARIKSYYLTK